MVFTKEFWAERGEKIEKMIEKMKKTKKEQHLIPANAWKPGKEHPFFGKPRSDSTKEKLRKANLGKVRTEESIRKQSDSRKKKFAEGKINIWNKGLTQETSDSVKNSIKKMTEWKQKNVKGKTYEELYGEEKAKTIKMNRNALMSEKHRGENNPMFGKFGDKAANWQGGKSFEDYGEEFNMKLKNQIRKRDNQVCMNCGIHREKLKVAFHIHHINYDKKCNLPQNLITLCRNCHLHTNGNREYWTSLFQEKLSKLYSYKYNEGKIVISVE